MTTRSERAQTPMTPMTTAPPPSQVRDIARERESEEPAFGTMPAAARVHVRIGELARELGLNPKTIRFYEKIGLLPTPQRTTAGYRLYGDADRSRLRFILQAKTIGFTLHEIGEILALRDAGQELCPRVRELIAHKLAMVDDQRRCLADRKRDLLMLQAEASATTCCGTPFCSIIELHASAGRTDDR
jgi:DNA-binding transcriptional MerR regulator